MQIRVVDHVFAGLTNLISCQMNPGRLDALAPWPVHSLNALHLPFSHIVSSFLSLQLRSNITRMRVTGGRTKPQWASLGTYNLAPINDAKADNDKPVGSPWGWRGDPHR